MKATMLSKKELDYLDHHLHHGLQTTVQGLDQLLAQKLITVKQHDHYMRAAIERHLKLWHEFAMDLMKKSICLLFAGLFTYMQVNGEDLDMRRSSRTRSGRRRNETEQLTN